jgi:hypothetical protein
VYLHDLNISKEDIKLVNWYMKKIPNIANPREMQITTARIYYITPVYKTRYTKCWRKCVEKGVLLNKYASVRHKENRVEVAQNTENRTTRSPAILLLEHISRKEISMLKRNLHSHVHCNTTYCIHNMESP